MNQAEKREVGLPRHPGKFDHRGRGIAEKDSVAFEPGDWMVLADLEISKDRSTSRGTSRG